MTISTNTLTRTVTKPVTETLPGFTTVSMRASNGAELHAKFNPHNWGGAPCYLISTDADDMSDVLGDGWYFDEAAADEAIIFFEKIKDEIKRRKEAYKFREVVQRAIREIASVAASVPSYARPPRLGRAPL